MVDRHPTDWHRNLRSAGTGRRMRSLLVALAAGAVLVTLIAATNSIVGAARSISNDATALSQTDEKIRAATVARTLTVLASVAANDGTTTPSTDEIRDAAGVLGGDSSSDTTRFLDAIDDVSLAVESGKVPLAEQVAEVENSFGQLLERLVADRADLAEALETSESRLNQIASLSGLALLFVVPTLAIGVYRAISRPDVEQRALAHAAAVGSTLNDNRLRAVADGIEDVRRVARMNASAAVIDQRLAEVNALAGVGADGGLRRRQSVDLRTVAASAVNRTELIDALPVTGSASPVVADEEQAVVLVAALLGTVAGRRNPSVQLANDGEQVLITIRAAEPVPGLERLHDTEVFDTPIDTVDERRMAAARALALDLGAEIVPFDDGALSGYVVCFPKADLGSADVADDSLAGTS